MSQGFFSTRSQEASRVAPATGSGRLMRLREWQCAKTQTASGRLLARLICNETKKRDNHELRTDEHSRLVFPAFPAGRFGGGSDWGDELRELGQGVGQRSHVPHHRRGLAPGLCRLLLLGLFDGADLWGRGTNSFALEFGASSE